LPSICIKIRIQLTGSLTTLPALTKHGFLPDPATFNWLQEAIKQKEGTWPQ
jgi:hypothetical protein